MNLNFYSLSHSFKSVKNQTPYVTLVCIWFDLNETRLKVVTMLLQSAQKSHCPLTIDSIFRKSRSCSGAILVVVESSGGGALWACCGGVAGVHPNSCRRPLRPAASRLLLMNKLTSSITLTLDFLAVSSYVLSCKTFEEHTSLFKSIYYHWIHELKFYFGVPHS
jgi:hypothetical protein